MLAFNDAISCLGLYELNLHGSKFTWSNKQVSPLLVRFDWFFASVSWITNYPGTLVRTISRDILDHHPCVVEISTDIPKAKIFRFENYWLLHANFMDVMNHGWAIPTGIGDRAGRVGAKFKT
jgi:hypothetical protein